MAAEKNKIDAIKSLESQGVLTTEEARKCIEVLNEEYKLNIDSNVFEDDLFFAD